MHLFLPICNFNYASAFCLAHACVIQPTSHVTIQLSSVELVHSFIHSLIHSFNNWTIHTLNILFVNQRNKPSISFCHVNFFNILSPHTHTHTHTRTRTRARKPAGVFCKLSGPVLKLVSVYDIVHKPVKPASA